MKAQISVPLRRGFALIATISVLLLLTLIAVAFLSLSAVTVSTSRIEWAEEEARANARLALMIAIGELQREMGPDQRVSATASILDQSEESEAITGIEEPHWVGVWASDWSKSSQGTAKDSTDLQDKLAWESDYENGGIKDRRSVEGWRAEDAVSTYLVSGNEGGRERRIKNGKKFQDAEDGVTNDNNGGRDLKQKLVDLGSVSDDEDVVNVKKVELSRQVRQPNGQTQDSPVGSYSYWISDEGVKASIDVVDRHSDKTPNPTNEDGYERVFYSQDIEEEAITGFGPISDEDRERFVSVQTARLSQVDEKDLKNVFHDVTTNSLSLLTNTRDGGLKKDLSVWLNESGDIRDLDSSRIEYQGLSGEDRLVGPPNNNYSQFMDASGSELVEEISPRFALIKNWLNDADRFNFSLTTNNIDLGASESDLKGQDYIEDYPQHQYEVYDRVLGEDENSLLKMEELEYVTYAPVVVEASMYYNVGYDKSGQNYRDWLLMYPRVALWNPYSVTMKVPPMLCYLFLNGNKRLKINMGSASVHVDMNLHSRTNTSDQLTPQNGVTVWYLADKGDGATGIEIPPGETYVYTVDLVNTRRKGGGNGGRFGDYSKSNFRNNLLSPKGKSSPQDFLLVGNAENNTMVRTEVASGTQTLEALRKLKPLNFIEDPASRDTHGGDNFQYLLLDATGHTNSRITGLEGLQDLPMVAVGNISLQAGGGDELPVRWPDSSPVPVYPLIAARSRIDTSSVGSGEPDFRTRDGFRMRWWTETETNIGNSSLGQNDMEKLFQTAGIANWNVRASFVTRNPWDNITEKEPYYFGNYTRDLVSEDAGFDLTSPNSVGGVQKGFPFGKSSGADKIVLFEVPSKNLGMPNLAYLRYLKLSELAWAPTYAIGNSIADPRSEMDGTAPDLSEFGDKNGWNVTTIGTAGQGNRGPDYWATLHREMLGELPTRNLMAFDMSYEVNFNLWDTYFVGSNALGASRRSNQMSRFAEDPSEDPLPNGRLSLINRSDLSSTVDDDLDSFFFTAARLGIRGGFNVNSTSVEAWKAILSSTSDVEISGSKGTIFPRLLNPSESEYTGTGLGASAYSGNRELSEDEVELLAEEMVVQVKKRGPFFGMADFVNRRLLREDVPELSRSGAIESAIELAGINSSFSQGGDLSIDNRDRDIGNTSFYRISDGTQLDHRLKPDSQAWGVSGYLTQGDVLGVIGENLTSRSDTFKVRAYGESLDINGNILARAWCEATVQRTPEPISPDEVSGVKGYNPLQVTGDQIDFGRRFKMVGFRWLTAKEV
ncbi:hypothetical protein N9165_00670 [Akkermansiaceae bacterium]|nr:hypothetical protein [Akkermansiaceae bacterium]